MKSTTCVFAGTFDPITVGHTYVINKCLEIFDKVIVAVGVNSDKSPLFSLNERLKMIKGAFSENPSVQVKTFDGMLVDFMKKENIAVNVRGIRNGDDYKYESNMASFNLDMYPEITTIFIPTPQDLAHVSSSAVRSIISYGADIDKYVPKSVVEVYKNKRV